MAETSARFDRTDEGEWFVMFERDGVQHSGPPEMDLHEALGMAIEHEESVEAQA